MSTVIGLLGDLYLSRTAPSDSFHHVGLDGADYWFANLEAPFTTAGDEGRQFRAWESGGGFKMDPSLVSELQGLSALSIANNHALDFGMDAYLECVDVLDAAGIGHAGGGRNASEARAPLLLESSGARVAFLAYTCLYQDGWSASASAPGMATIKIHTSYEPPLRVFEQPGYPPVVRTRVDAKDAQRVRDEVSEAKRNADIVVVSVHWGLSAGDRAVVEYQEELGTLVLDAGADAVFGHHPHALQPLVVHNGKPLFLSMGNIVFDYDKAWRGSPVTASARLFFGPDGLERAVITPLVRDEQSDPVPCDDDEAKQVAKRLFPDSSAVAYDWVDGDIVVSLA